MCVCVCVCARTSCLYVCMSDTFESMSKWCRLQGMYVCMYVCMCVCMCVCMRAYACYCACLRFRSVKAVQFARYVYVCMCVYIYVYMLSLCTHCASSFTVHWRECIGGSTLAGVNWRKCISGSAVERKTLYV